MQTFRTLGGPLLGENNNGRLCSDQFDLSYQKYPSIKEIFPHAIISMVLSGSRNEDTLFTISFKHTLWWDKPTFIIFFCMWRCSPDLITVYNRQEISLYEEKQSVLVSQSYRNKKEKSCWSPRPINGKHHTPLPPVVVHQTLAIPL